MVMFHAAKTAIWDDATAEELRDTASSLEAFNAYSAKMIARRTGLSESEAAALIEGRKESFYGATDLIEANLADAIQGEAPAEPVRLPSAKAIRNLSHKLPAGGDIGGLLAAVAVAAFGDCQNTKEGSMPKKKKMTASAESKAEPVIVDCAEETATAVVDETATVDAVEEKPAEEAKAEEQKEEVATTAESETPAEDPAPAEEQEAETEETPVEEETTAEPTESDEVKALRAELAQMKAAVEAAVARAEAAENALADAKKSVVNAALTPPAAPVACGKPVAVAWREAVRACGNNIATAKEKHPDLFAALTK